MDPPFDLRFKCPANYFLAGSTQSGKTSWLLEFFKQQPVTQPIKHLIYYYSDDDKAHEKFKAIPNLNIKFRQGCPETLEEIKDEIRQFPKEDHKAIVFDDLYNDLRDYMNTLWTVTGSHTKTSCFLLAQSLYGSKQLRLLSLNSMYCIVFRNPRDQRVFTTLASQVAPSKSALLKKALQLATQRPWGYCVLDFGVSSNDMLRFRTNIFKHEYPSIAYIL